MARGGSTVLEPVKERRAIRPGEGGLGDAWKVVVLNDNHNTFEGVAFTLATVLPNVDYDKGMTMANKIHHEGRAVVWSGHKELAELYHEQLGAKGLTMAELCQ